VPKIGIALARGELDRVKALLAEPVGAGASDTWFLAPWLVARLRAMAALGDRRSVEEEASRLLGPTTYLEPFALQALGLVRRDSDLLERAASRFQQMGLRSFAHETTRLMTAPA
jgi:hypothetical protein